ncbi:MAG: UDP-glucose 4-epimerase [Myxococcota bacterium]|jgi:UDP-glucose 4-epimerase
MTHWLGRRVLVTGASGFIGQAVCELLLESEAEVHGSYRSRLPPADVIAHPAHFPEDATELLDRVRPDTVIHLASPIHLGRQPHLYPLMRAGILDATAAIAAGCLKHGARLLHVGTCAEYGDQPPPLSPSLCPAPLSPYAALKSAATHWVMTMARTGGLQAGVVRPFRAFGPRDTSSVLSLVCRAVVTATPLDLTDGAQVREWNDVYAIATGIIAAAGHPDAVGRILNLGGGHRLSVRAVCEMIADLAKADRSLLRFGARPRRAGEPETFFGDHSLTTDLLGPLPHPPLPDSLTATLEWHRAHPD